MQMVRSPEGTKMTKVLVQPSRHALSEADTEAKDFTGWGSDPPGALQDLAWERQELLWINSWSLEIVYKNFIF